MSVTVRPVSGPVNLNAFIAGLCAGAAWQFWPDGSGGVVTTAAAGLCSAVALASVMRVVRLAVKDYTLRKTLAKAERPSTDHGTAREADWSEIVSRSMHDPASGNFLGLYAGKYPVFVSPKTPFALIEMPPGAGKTVNYVINSILHQARLGRSLFIPDVKTELAPMLVAALKAMGIEVQCINPAKVHMDLCGDADVNLYQAVLDALHSKGLFRKDTIKLALDLSELHLPELKGSEDKNVYFRNGSRRCICIAILSQAMLDPARCTPSDVFALLNDPKRFRERLVLLRYEIVRLFIDDPIAAFLQTEAANLLDKFENNAENAASFLEGATQTLLTFNQGGRMAGYGRMPSFNIADMRQRQIAVFVMSPLSHTRDFAPVVSLLNHSLLEVAKRDPAGHPVHIVGEEALNYRFADIVSDLETMRGLKFSAEFYIQSFDGLVRKLGPQAAAAMEAYCDLTIYAGLTDFHRARHVSDMLADATIRRQDYSYKADVQDIGVSSREQARRIMMPDEILAMPRGEAWVFTRGLRPMRLNMAHYGQVTPWRDEVAANPLEGSALKDKPLFAIRYPATGTPGKPVIEGIRFPRSSVKKAKHTFVAPVRLRHLLWLPPLLVLLSMPLRDVPLPHIRASYTWSGTADQPFYHPCTYLGPHSRAVEPDRGQCPLIVFLSRP